MSSIISKQRNLMLTKQSADIFQQFNVQQTKLSLQQPFSFALSTFLENCFTMTTLNHLFSASSISFKQQKSSDKHVRTTTESEYPLITRLFVFVAVNDRMSRE